MTEEEREDLRGKRIAKYARVSTRDKDQNPETQLIPMRDLCELWGSISNPEDEYIDFDSGANKKDLDIIPRPRFRALFNSLDKYDGIIAVRPDRAFRNRTDWGIYLRKIQRANKFIYFLERHKLVNKDTLKTELDGLGFEFQAVEMYSSILSDAVKGGIARKRREAEREGKPFEYGKRKTKYKGIPLPVIDKDKVIQLHKSGLYTIRAIAKELDIGRGRVWTVIKEAKAQQS